MYKIYTINKDDVSAFTDIQWFTCHLFFTLYTITAAANATSIAPPINNGVMDLSSLLALFDPITLSTLIKIIEV